MDKSLLKIIILYLVLLVALIAFLLWKELRPKQVESLQVITTNEVMRKYKAKFVKLSDQEKELNKHIVIRLAFIEHVLEARSYSKRKEVN